MCPWAEETVIMWRGWEVEAGDGGPALCAPKSRLWAAPGGSQGSQSHPLGKGSLCSGVETPPLFYLLTASRVLSDLSSQTKNGNLTLGSERTES